MIKLQKKHYVLAGLVALLAITGVVNYSINQAAGSSQPVALATPTPTGEEPSEQTGVFAGITYYSLYRKERNEARTTELAYLDEMLNDTRLDAESIREAGEMKLALLASIETEAVTEGQIKAKGFSECVVTMRNGAVTVIVEEAEGLTSEQAVQIMEIVRRETGVSAENIKIMPRS